MTDTPPPPPHADAEAPLGGPKRLVPPPPGRIDLHSHVIPGIDDGCDSLRESIKSIRQLKKAGYTATICTPHLWPDAYPTNTPDTITRLTRDLQRAFDDQGEDYRFYPGGELRLFPGVTDWLEQVGVPTLGPSRLVLMDYWRPDWASYIDDTIDWLIEREYTPVLAHPERSVTRDNFVDHLRRIIDKGTLLQGNVRPFFGGDGRTAQAMAEQLLEGNLYTFLAIDMHRPGDLTARLNGLTKARKRYGEERIDQLTITNPRRYIFDL